MSKDCGCGGSRASARVSAGATGPRFALKLPNGSTVGDYPTQSHAELQNATTFAGKGVVVPR